jgi:hypothetical protein
MHSNFFGKELQHYYTIDLSSIAQNAFSLGDFGDRDYRTGLVPVGVTDRD